MQLSNHRVRPATREELAAEPFRILFSAGVLAGILGALLWPLHLWFGIGPFPGLQHAHLMVCGFFGGFIFGFLGTAGPRLLGVSSLKPWQVILLGVLHVTMSIGFAVGNMMWGTTFFLISLSILGLWMGLRWVYRTCLPPPGFVTLPMAFACAWVGSALSLANLNREVEPFWVQIQKLMLYQGFPLLPILGIGPFLFPRFFGSSSLHDFEDSGPMIPRGWIRESILSGSVGIGVLFSFWLEATGWIHLGPALRASLVASHFARTLPWRQSAPAGRALGRMLRWGWIGLIAGLASRAVFPVVHVALMHWVFIGGFALITLAAGTRVVCGHCGTKHLIEGRGRWITTILVLVLLGMWTRISGDFWPKIQKTHFSYGALLWIAALLTWAWHVLPGTLRSGDE